jgi:hypothetical protein
MARVQQPDAPPHRVASRGGTAALLMRLVVRTAQNCPLRHARHVATNHHQR